MGIYMEQDGGGVMFQCYLEVQELFPARMSQHSGLLTALLAAAGIIRYLFMLVRNVSDLKLGLSEILFNQLLAAP